MAREWRQPSLCGRRSVRRAISTLSKSGIVATHTLCLGPTGYAGEGCSPAVPSCIRSRSRSFQTRPISRFGDAFDSKCSRYTFTTWYANYITATCAPIPDKGTAMCWTLGLGSYLWSKTAYMSAINEKRRVKQIAPPCGL